MRVLAAVDGGRYSEEIMEAVAHLVRDGDEVHVLSIVDPGAARDTYSASGGPAQHTPGHVVTATGQTMPSQDLRRGSVESAAQAAQRLVNERRGHLEALLHRVPGTRRWQIHVDVDSAPAEAIIRTADQLRVHGIAMGTRGRGGVAHMLLGSVAEYVIRRASVPVLVVRDGLEVPRPTVDASNGSA